jgi:hypothetical protein
MRRWCATLLLVVTCSAVVRADVTIVQRTTIEGGMMAMAPGGAPSPTMTNRIKGLKARMEMEMGNAPVPINVSTITDLAAKQIIVLMHDQKVAQVITPQALVTPPAGAAVSGVKIDSSLTSTGKSQVIDGLKCDQYTFTTSISMAEAGGPNAGPEAAAMMKDLVMKMNGSMWVAREAPGVAEYRAFQKAASSLGSSVMAATRFNMPGMEQAMKAMTDVDGIAYLTEIDMTIEGAGQMADMMRKMGAMKLITRVTSIRTDPLSDELFTIPAGYTKQ